MLQPSVSALLNTRRQFAPPPPYQIVPLPPPATAPMPTARGIEPPPPRPFHSLTRTHLPLASPPFSPPSDSRNSPPPPQPPCPPSQWSAI
ncbi:UNVERIFIED_CONTAM: hypothetical protein Sradi_5838900 [Sesamum radiatum]|uniref:Uncharacterized protein n=1 Tax=Sesamum radiatum TaxID=300843 RepID=A0AAW2KTC2_SESRA